MIQERIKIFLDKWKKKQHLTKIKLRFDEIRPGNGMAKIDIQPIPYASKGTVVTIGKRCIDGNEEFVKLANDFVE